MNNHVHFKFERLYFSLYNVIGWTKQHSCSHALYLENTGLRCTSLSNSMYGWNIQYVQRDSFLLPLVRHHSYKNEQYAIQSNCAEHAINLSNMCLYFYIFTKVQYTIHCRTAESRVVFKMHDFLKKKCSRYSSFSGSTCLKFQLRFHAQSQCVTFFQQGSAFQAKYRWCLEKV